MAKHEHVQGYTVNTLLFKKGNKEEIGAISQKYFNRATDSSLANLCLAKGTLSERTAKYKA